MKIRPYAMLLFMLIFMNCSQKVPNPITPEIIPIPLSQTLLDGSFLLDNSVALETPTEFKKVTTYLSEVLKKQHQITLKNQNSTRRITFILNQDIKNDEGYHLSITPNQIIVNASSERGAFYAIQSLLQLIPVATSNGSLAIQCLEIKDEPQFVYRGMHLDVGRHFFPVSFVKKYIDMLAMLKMNTFHWHLTEDQGWRIEIKKYPKLQEIAAFRNETIIGHNSDTPQQFDGKKYGGFYTQDEIKEVVQYALDRQITIIPEIEMPGHSQAALAAYPELGCTGDSITVATKWGVFEDIYCTKESTFKFLEDVIDEVVTLFPGKYIHIGGDEAPKTRWKNCKHCQELIKKEGLKDEFELQSYFITRMEKYINTKGKQIIGWDEILEGGLAPNATVMSWRGIKGAVEAAKEHHNVVLTPGSHCYFDHYQSTNEGEPLAIGGYLPLEKVYEFNPIPEELTKDETKFVLGAQGNVWTEYMKTPEHVEYMIFPRMIALSEVVWSSPKNKDFEHFKKRLTSFFNRLDSLSVNYANHLYEIEAKVLHTKDSSVLILAPKTGGKDIRYTVDGKEPTAQSLVYTKPIKIDKTVLLKAASFNNTEKISPVFSKQLLKHKAIGQHITYSVAPYPGYAKGGNTVLINGIKGSDERYKDKEWLGFNTTSVTITIDFDEPTEISTLKTRFFQGIGSWIYAPKELTITTNTGFEQKFELNNTNEHVLESTHHLTKQMVNQLKITIPSFGNIPQGNPGAGNNAWLFIDELVVE